jgi:beta-glucosidase
MWELIPAWQKGSESLHAVLANMLRGHAAAYRAIHELQPESRVGYALHFRPMVPRTGWSPLDRLMRNIRYEGSTWASPPAISTGVMKSPLGNLQHPRSQRHAGLSRLNYYSVDTVWFDITKPGECFQIAATPKMPT